MAAALALATVLFLVPGPGVMAANEAPSFHYRIDLTQQPAEVVARFPLRESKDFAFLITMTGHPIRNLVVQDARGVRTIRNADEPGVFRVDGLAAGTVEASYRLDLGGDCRERSCRSRDSVLLRSGDILLHPMGVDPAFNTPSRIHLVLPTEWTLVTPKGPGENSVTASTLAELSSTPVLAGLQVINRTAGGEMLVIQSTGWRLDPEIVGGLVASLLREQETLLGGRADGGGRMMRVLPQERGGQASFTPISDQVSLLELPANADRQALARSLVGPLTSLFSARLESGLAGATSPETLWWRYGFTEYTTLLAAVRVRAVSEASLLNRLLQAWLNVANESPLAGQTSLAAAGGQPGDAATAFARDGGLLACFVLDLRIRHATGHASGLGDLLSATRGREVTNELLGREATRLAGTDLSSLLRLAVESPAPPPFPEEVLLAGLELIDAGTGEPFIGLLLEPDEPVISHVFETGPAKARGLRPGDWIVSVDDVPVDGPATVEMMLAARKPGDPVEVSVRSENGEIYTAVLNLWERVSPVLRRSNRASLSAVNAWRNLTHGEATTFAN
jgi:hypothetical protein